ncbi:MAG: 4-hydroxy-tetrahydrodipicolinate synthase [Chloroflexi bacterium]|nr:4-hydroxy-tetrahydrodipicolinate synthase [Chloroflexota bacterium]
MAGFTRLEGVMVALATPLNEDETIDERGLRRQLDRLIEAGVHTIVALGTAGEFAALSDEAKRDAIAITVDQVAGRVPVIAGTGEPGTKRAVRITRMAAELGADAAMVVPPYYYRMTDEAVLTHYRILAAEGGLPIILYNIPGMTQVTLSPEVVRQLAVEPGIVGLKDSGGNLGYFQQIVRQSKSAKFGVVTGSDGLLFATLAVGGDGCISPGTNVAPEWFVGLWNAVKEGRWSDAWAFQERILDLGAIYRYGTFPAGIKGALSALGIAKPCVHAPLAAVTGAQVEQIRARLQELGLL